MSDEAQAEETQTREADAETESTDEQTRAVLDADAIEDTESVEDLEELVNEQQERIEELEDLLLDLSTRVADGNSMGVCPDCHGAVLKTSSWFRSSKIKCTDCGRVFHEY